MGVTLKRIEEQVVVITGASSGIGLATAKMAAERGARVVLAARDADGLASARVEIEGSGGRAITVIADVSVFEDVRSIARRAIEAFGAFDTWVNNAGVSIYGRLEDVPLEDQRRLFDVNFWGTVHGCRTALRHLKSHGGVLINVGSIVSDRAIPLQGVYSASKAAIKGYTDALRMELDREHVPVAVTLVKPAAIATPYIDHARTYMTEKPTLPPPAYHPDVAARAILRCAERPVREVVVGGAGHLVSTLGRVAPSLTDKYMENVVAEQQKSSEKIGPREGSLNQPGDDGRELGSYGGYVMKSSAYTRARLSPLRYVLPAAAAIAFAVVSRR